MAYKRVYEVKQQEMLDHKELELLNILETTANLTQQKESSSSKPKSPNIPPKDILMSMKSFRTSNPYNLLSNDGSGSSDSEVSVSQYMGDGNGSDFDIGTI